MPKVTLTVPSVYETEGVRFLPGVNTITDVQLAKLMSNKHVAADFARGLLVKGAVSEPIEAKAETVVEDTGALVTLAQGDGRKRDVQAARTTLEEMGIDWQ